MKKNNYKLPCNIAQTLNIIGDRWTLLIIHEIMSGRNTFKELENSLAGIASNLLAVRLKSLKEDGIIKIQKYADHPVRYKYIITDKGRDLEDVFNTIILWGRKHLDVCYKKLISKDSGKEVEIGYYVKDERKLLNKSEIKIENIDINF